MSMLQQYAEQCYQNSASKGFWEEGKSRNKGKMIMLMLSELSESMEADREGKWLLNKGGGVKTYSEWYRMEGHRHSNSHHGVGRKSEEELWNLWFVQFVKNTVEDEIADTVIRLLDYVCGWGLPLHPREYRHESTGDFANDLLRIGTLLIHAYHNHLGSFVIRENKAEEGDFRMADGAIPGHDFGYALAAIEQLAKDWAFDLEEHIKMKMSYNATRPHKHNKAY